MLTRVVTSAIKLSNFGADKKGAGKIPPRVREHYAKVGLSHEHPLVAPQVTHFMQVPLRKKREFSAFAASIALVPFGLASRTWSRQVSTSSTTAAWTATAETAAALSTTAKLNSVAAEFANFCLCLICRLKTSSFDERMKPVLAAFWMAAIASAVLASPPLSS